MRWKTPIPGEGISSPIVWGDQVIVTAARPTVENGPLVPVALGVLTLLCAGVLWRLTDGSLADPLGVRSGAWQSEPKGVRLSRKALGWLLFVAVGYGTIAAMERGYDFLGRFPESLRERLLDKTWFFTDAPVSEGNRTPLSTFRILTGKEIEGPYFGAPRIPLACYYGGALAVFTVLALNSAVARRYRRGSPVERGSGATDSVRGKVTFAGKTPPEIFPTAAPRAISAGSVARAAREWSAAVLTACFLVTVHSAAMAGLPYAPGGTTWFLAGSIAVLGLTAFELLLPVRPLCQLAGILLGGGILAWIITAAPGNKEFGVYATAMRAGLRPLVVVWLGASALALSAPTFGRRGTGYKDRGGPSHLGGFVAPVAVLLSGCVYFFQANYLVPRSVCAREVISVDRSTGAIRWTTRCDAGEVSRRMHAANTLATPTPVSDGEHVFVHFGEAGLFCLDMAGRVKWRFEEPVAPSHWGAASSPVLWRDLVIMTYDSDHQSFTVGVDKARGVERWRTDRTGLVEPSQLHDAYATPVLAERGDRTELVHQACKLLAGYDPATGGTLWTYSHPGEQPVASPVIADGMIIVLGGKYAPYLGAVRLTREGGGEVAREAWHATKCLSDMPSPVAYEGHLYMVTKDGIATCIDAKTGEYQWRQRLKGAFWASAVAGDGKVYFCNADGTTTVVAASPRYQVLGVNELADEVRASFAVSGGSIFVRTRDGLVRIGPADAPRSAHAALP
jgi:outer membrane protein assembly factor BamB